MLNLIKCHASKTNCTFTSITINVIPNYSVHMSTETTEN